MLSPEPGDVMIREAVSGYVLVDAVSLRELSGSYLTIPDAFVAARDRISAGGHIWRENLDRRGRPLGYPFLLELQASPLA